MCVCARTSGRVCVRAHVCVCVRARARVCARGCVCVFLFVPKSGTFMCPVNVAYPGLFTPFFRNVIQRVRLFRHYTQAPETTYRFRKSIVYDTNS